MRRLLIAFLLLLLLGGNACRPQAPPPSLPARADRAAAAVSSGETADDVPIADLGTVLEMDPATWRGRRYEYYRWAERPQVLVFDTLDYEIQSRLFKRLAFFVEKTGWVGTIPDFDEIADLHGFNAHDYRRDDLASFFSKAESEGVPLLPAEAELLQILLATGVIKRSGARYVGGEGAVISVSRSSSPALRRRFITHEALHALFFTVPPFREACLEIWDTCPEELRQYFLLYFSWPDWSYDTSNQVLMANEFMAYHLQLRREEVLPYFVERGMAWLRERFPSRETLLDRLENELPEVFLRSYDRLEEALRTHCGLSGGGLADSPAG
jgi:hypothetical protein